MRASVGFCPLVAPFFRFGGFSGAGLIRAVLSLPSCVLGLVFCFLSCVASLCLWFCRVGVSACAIAGVFPWSSCSFQWVVGPLCVCLVFWLLSAPLPACCCFPSPCGWSLVAPWPSLYAGPSLWVSGCICDGLVALLAGSVAVLCCPHFTLPHGSKGLWPCVGCVAPSPPCCKCC